MKSDLAMHTKKYLPGILIGLLVFVVMISPRVYAGADSNADGTCNTNGTSTSVAPSPYGNGAPISKVFYPSDGSTVTVTTTGAVIKQSPCQTPYREGWVDPSSLCNLNSFSQLSGMVKSGDNNPYANSSYSGATGSCNSNYTTTPSVVNNISNTNTSSSASSATATAAPYNTAYTNNNSYCNTSTSICCNTSNTNNYNNSNCCNSSSANNNNCCNNSTYGCCNTSTTNCCTGSSVNCCNNSTYGCCNSSSTNCCNNGAYNCCNSNYSSANCNTSSSNSSASSTNCCNTSTLSSNTSKTTTLPNTGPSDVLAVGGISTVLGTVGHFFYRRRALN